MSRYCVNEEDVVNEIQSVLVSEGYQIPPPELMTYQVHQKKRTNMPRLFHLLHKCIYKNINILSLQGLPTPLSNSIHNFTILQKWSLDDDSN